MRRRMNVGGEERGMGGGDSLLFLNEWMSCTVGKQKREEEEEDEEEDEELAIDFETGNWRNWRLSIANLPICRAYRSWLFLLFPLVLERHTVFLFDGVA